MAAVSLRLPAVIACIQWWRTDIVH